MNRRRREDHGLQARTPNQLARLFRREGRTSGLDPLKTLELSHWIRFEQENDPVQTGAASGETWIRLQAQRDSRAPLPKLEGTGANRLPGERGGTRILPVEEMLRDD